MGSALLSLASPNRTRYLTSLQVWCAWDLKQISEQVNLNLFRLCWLLYSPTVPLHRLPADTSPSFHGDSSHQGVFCQGWWGENRETRHIAGDYALILTRFFLWAACRSCAVRSHPSVGWTRHGGHCTLRLWPAQQPSSGSSLPLHQEGPWGEIRLLNMPLKFIKGPVCRN